MTSLVLVLCATLSAEADTFKPLGAKWMRYENGRFGTALDLPATFRPVDPPLENGDGRQFQDENGTTVLVSGSYSPEALMTTFEDYKLGLAEDARRNGLDIVYQKSGKGWIVFSGQKNGRLVYTKAIDGCGAAHEFTIDYAAEKKRDFDPVVSRMSKSLTCRRSSRSPKARPILR
jgi:hypothetical protein